MDIKDLKYFVAVYEAKGFSRAALELDTVQSNVSARVMALERFLGVPLFERLHRGVVPTRQGKKLYSAAKRVISALEVTVRASRHPGHSRRPRRPSRRRR